MNASHLYLLALMMMTGPPLATRWRSGKSARGRKRERKGKGGAVGDAFILAEHGADGFFSSQGSLYACNVHG